MAKGRHGVRDEARQARSRSRALPAAVGQRAVARRARRLRHSARDARRPQPGARRHLRQPAFEGFFGYRAGDALGRPLAKLLFRNDEPLVHRLLAEPSSRWKLQGWAKDGAVRHVEVSLGAVHSADGELTHWVVAFSDRSEVEKLRAELEGLKSLAAAP